MERQRVLYVAKTKTSKVMHSSSTKRPLSFPSSLTPTTEENLAPLASSEPDILGIRGGVATKQTVCHNGPTRIQSADGIILNGHHSETVPGIVNRHYSGRDKRQLTPPRTYVRQRSAKTNELHKDCASSKHEQVKSEPVQHRQSQVESTRCMKNGYHFEDAKFPANAHQNGSTNINKSHQAANNPRSSKRDNRKQGNNIQHNPTTVVRARPHEYPQPKPKDVIEKQQPLPSQSKTATSETVKSGTKQFCSNSESRNSSLHLQTSKFLPREEPRAAKENQTGRKSHVVLVPRSHQTSRIGTKQSTSAHKSTREHSEYQHVIPQIYMDEESTQKDYTPALQPGLSLPLNYSQNDTDTPPEMCNSLGSRNSTDASPRLIPERYQYASNHTSQPHSCPRTPLASIEITVNTPVSYSTSDVKNSFCSDVNATDIPRSVENSQNIVVNTELQKNTDCNYNGTSVPSGNCIHLLDPELKRSWKRNSLRLATQGYTSMSDLTASLECLDDCQGEVATTNSLHSSRDDNQLKHNGEQLHCVTTNELQIETESLETESTMSTNSLGKHSHDVARKNVEEEAESIPEDDVSNLNKHHEQPEKKFERNGVNRLSYRIATSASISDISILEDYISEKVHDKIRDSAALQNKHPQSSQNFFESQTRIYSWATTVASQLEEVSNINHQQSRFSDSKTQEEHTNKIKRLSFLLATSSITDLTLANSDLDFANKPLVHGDNGSPVHDTSLTGVTASNDSNNRNFGYGRFRDDSDSKIGGNLGIIDSVRTPVIGVEVLQNDILSGTKNQTCSSKYYPLTYTLNNSRDSANLDKSASTNTSFYYTASSPDTSFVTTDGDALSSPRCMGSPKQSPQLSHSQTPPSDHRRKSPRVVTHNPSSPGMSGRTRKISDENLQGKNPPSPLLKGQKQEPFVMCNDQKQIFPNNKCRQFPQDSTVSDSSAQQVRHLSPNVKTSKHSNPVNMLQCYGCGLNNRAPAHYQWTRNNSRRTPVKYRYSENGNKTSERCLSVIETNNLKHSPRLVHTEDPKKTNIDLTFKVRTCAEVGTPQNDQSSSTSGIPSTPSTSSLISLVEDPARRSPPSLGKPRRKMYAGFDSQPLPMDSCMTDSSSVFSVQSFGSWGASRSAEVESSTRTPAIFPSVRSVSSIASSTYGSTRYLPGDDDVFDFSYSDKNNDTYDLPLNTEKSGKRLSNESLGSIHSDDTTVGVGYHESQRQNEPHVYTNSRFFNTNFASTERTETSPNGYHTDRLTDSCSSEFGTRFSYDNHSSQARNGNNVKQEARTANDSVCSGKNQAKMTPRGKQFSSRDILDLILTAENTSHSPTRSFEKQAKKMYEVILCCDEMDRPSVRECFL